MGCGGRVNPDFFGNTCAGNFTGLLLGRRYQGTFSSDMNCGGDFN